MALVQMPKEVLTRIMEKLDFGSLLTLRKVCRDLRNFIEDVVPSSSISEIYVRINTTHISLRILDPQVISNDKSIEIKYRGHMKGCSIDKTSGIGKKKQLLGKEDFVNFFWKDFEQILKHQRSRLEVFSLVLEHYEYKMAAKNNQINARFLLPIMEKFEELLNSRIDPLKVKMLDFGIIEQHEAMWILPFIDERFLEKISIGNSKGLGRMNLKLGELVRLNQWKSAREVKINEFYISERLKSFEHFSKVEITMKVVNAETVRFLREIFHQNPAMKHFEIDYDPSRGRPDLRTLYGHRFDGSYDDENGGARWIFRIPKDSEDVISIRTNMHNWMCFTRVKLEDISDLRVQ